MPTTAEALRSQIGIVGNIHSSVPYQKDHLTANRAKFGGSRISEIGWQ